jgi:hypothetical protein
MFDLSAHATSVRREILAGCTTYLTVNPLILATAGVDHGAAFVATCIAAAIGSAAMGLMANLPLALAPDMGLNASRDRSGAAVCCVIRPCHGGRRRHPVHVLNPRGYRLRLHCLFVVKAAGKSIGAIAGAAWLVAGLSLLRLVLE